jgi:transposase
MDGDELLTGTNCWRLATLAIEADGSVTFSVVPSSPTARCPMCDTPSARRHSWYQRTALDLPWRGRTVRLRLWTRRWFCDEPACPQTIFTERFPGLLGRYARRTDAATRLLLSFAQRAGGEAGARLARDAGFSTSPDTLLRLLRAQAGEPVVAPRALGVDEFALRRGHRYGLLLVDLEQRRPLDVLPDDEAATLAAWLRSHPGTGIVTRDRGPHIKEGVSRGAPAAIQIVDRFHLLRNVVDALDELQRQQRRAGSAAFRDAARSTHVAGAAMPTGPPPEQPPPAGSEPQPSRRAGPAQWERAHALRRDGWSIRAIARDLGRTPKTVRRLLARSEPPRQQVVHQRPIPRLVEPFLPYLRQRWAEGCRNGRQLTREIEQQGYTGSGASVRWMLARWRPPKACPSRPRLRRQHVRWLLLRAADRLEPDEQRDLERVLAADAVLARGYALVQRFREVLHQRDVAGFEQWLSEAMGCGLGPFVSLAAGMMADLEAIRNAFRYPWSTGPVEGHINRVKLIKRQGYGRAKVPLLRARILGPN